MHEELHALAAAKNPIVLCVCVCVCVKLFAQFCRPFQLYRQTNATCLRAKEENDEEVRRRVATQGR